LLAGFGAGGCVEPYMLTDGTSVSLGEDTNGRLRHGAQLPSSGDGYVIGNVWVARHSNYATDELIDGVVHTCRVVTEEFPGALAGVGDLSYHDGGFDSRHKSHQSGRDVDLLYFGDDAQGNLMPPPDFMVPFRQSADGLWSIPIPWGSSEIVSRRFDLPRNWAMVKAWLTEPDVQVQWIFMYEPLREALLSYAETQDEPRDLIERADAILHQPLDALPHDDHMHVRIYCSPSDVAQGCIDTGPERWLKKFVKYDGRFPVGEPPIDDDLARALAFTPHLPLLPDLQR
jgi:penicillin-insensitive murein endopeptidase